MALFVPEGCAHGFLTLEDGAEVFYTISAPYAPESGRGVRYNDPAFGIEWPAEVRVIHPRDAAYPLVGSRPSTVVGAGRVAPSHDRG